MRKALWGGLAVIWLASVSGALAEPRMIYGTGLESCGTWTRLRQEGRSPQRLMAETWVAGFLSSANLPESQPDFLIGTDSNGLEGWIDNYCRANPLKAIVFAATSLIEDLRGRAKH